MPKGTYGFIWTAPVTLSQNRWRAFLLNTKYIHMTGIVPGLVPDSFMFSRLCVRFVGHPPAPCLLMPRAILRRRVEQAGLTPAFLGHNVPMSG